MKNVLPIIAFSLLFCTCGSAPEMAKDSEQGKTEKPYSADWASLAKKETPDWFRDAKFGIYTQTEMVWNSLTHKESGCTTTLVTNNSQTFLIPV